MEKRSWSRWLPGLVVALGALLVGRAIASTDAPLAIDSARVTIAGTSNIHEYTASTTTVRVTRSQTRAQAGPDFWQDVLAPGGVEAFEIAIPAATLTSPREGLDKNMHKALKAQEHPQIVFRLLRLDSGPGSSLKATGMLNIAGVEREIGIDLKTERRDSTLTVKGEVQLLMTDYGIKPPTAMLGMLKADPKVTVVFEVVLGIPLA